MKSSKETVAQKLSKVAEELAVARKSLNEKQIAFNKTIEAEKAKIASLTKLEEKLAEAFKELHQDIIDKWEATGQLELVCVDADNSDDFREIGEDDGTLHVSVGKLRGCFISDQFCSRKEWNARARAIKAQIK